jgi:hypothetical protein
MNSAVPAACSYCKQIPAVFESRERRGNYRVACHNQKCRGELISNIFDNKNKAIRAWNFFLSERALLLKRLRDFYAIHLALWQGLVVWNDIRRYPDLPPNSKETPLQPSNKRNTTNEFHIRYLSSAHEAYLALALWNLLFDETEGTKGHLRKLAERLLKCGVRSKNFQSESLNDCLSFLGNKRSAKAFREYRHMRLAHLGTDEETKDVHLNSDLIYRLAPKTSYLFEILHEELERLPSHTDNQWSVNSLIIAPFFSHSSRDESLFTLFRSRTLASEKYRMAIKNFIARRNRRERKARAFSSVKKKARTPRKLVPTNLSSRGDPSPHAAGQLEDH